MKSTVTAIGVMSGTSMDGIDVALLRSDGESLVAPGPGFSAPYEPALAAELRALVADPLKAEGDLGDLQARVTDAHVQAVENFVRATGVVKETVDCVGFHGQTVLHRPEKGVTRQLFDGPRAARRLGIDVFCDFRAADVRAGGEGAPLAPAYHAAIAAGLDKPLMILNWGGVGNVTYLDADDGMCAFDTGPANALIDDFVRERRGFAHDADGALAASGQVDRALLDAWMRDPYFRRPAPKSLDRNHFRALTRNVAELSDADGAATLTAFTIEATAAALAIVPTTPRLWLVAGGGRRNGALMRGLAARLGATVEPIESIGYDGDQLEAQLFAYLAIRSRSRAPISFPTTTGAPRPLTGGAFWPKA